VTAVVAVDAQEPMGEDTALEIAPNLAFDEASDGGARGSRACEERFELGSDDGVEEGLLGLVTFVPIDGEGAHRDRVLKGQGTRSERPRDCGRCREVPMICVRRRCVKPDSREDPTRELAAAWF